MEKRRSGYIILILLCLVLVVAAAALSGVGKGGKTAPPTQTAQAAVTPPAVEATPVPTPSATPPVYPDLTEKAAAADGSFSDTVFVGNSLVDGLYLYGGLTGCRWLSGTGVSLYNVAKQTISDKVGGECTVTQGLSAKQYGRVYLELGINEIGMSVADFTKAYGAFIDSVRALQPGAQIYVLSLTPVSAKKSADGGYFTKENVQAFNTALHQLCADKSCWYMDCFTPLADGDGYLPDSATSDGIHFKPSYYAKWMDVIRTHYAEN